MGNLGKKCLSITILIIYASTQVVLGSLAEAQLWKNRQERLALKKSDKNNLWAALPFSNTILPSNQKNLLNKIPSINTALPQLSKINDSISRKRISLPKPVQSLVDAIPLSHSSIRDIYNSGDPTHSPILLIQDVHLNAEAQTNIAAVLQELINKKQVGMVGVEGAFGSFNFSPFREFPNRAIAHGVTQAFLDKNLLGAPSYVGIMSALDPPVFIGVDDKKHYDANVSAYVNAMALKAGVLQQITELKKELVEEKAKVFSSKLQKFDELRSAYRRGDIKLGGYVKHLSMYKQFTLGNVIPAKAGIQSLPKASITTGFPIETPDKDIRGQAFGNDGHLELTLQQFLEAYEMEERLDFARVDQERRGIIETLVKSLSAEEMSALLAESLAYRMGRLNFANYYQHLRGLCEAKGISLNKTPAFDNYIRYVLLADGVQVEKLFAAIEKTEDGILQDLVKTSGEKKFIQESERLYLLEKLVEFELTPEEWGKYKQLRDAFNSAIPLKSFASFYEEADLRSRKMVENLLKSRSQETEARRQNKEKSFHSDSWLLTSGSLVLIAGGFHTPDIAKHLRDKKISYIVVSPKVTKGEEASGTAYLSIFAREKTPLENLFEGEKLFIYPKRAHISDGATALRWWGSSSVRLQEAEVGETQRVNARPPLLKTDTIPLSVKRAQHPADDEVEPHWTYYVFGVQWEMVFWLIGVVGLRNWAPALQDYELLLLTLTSLTFTLLHFKTVREVWTDPQEGLRKLSILFAIGWIMGVPFLKEELGFLQMLSHMEIHSAYNALAMVVNLLAGKEILPIASIKGEEEGKKSSYFSENPVPKPQPEAQNDLDPFLTVVETHFFGTGWTQTRERVVARLQADRAWASADFDPTRLLSLFEHPDNAGAFISPGILELLKNRSLRGGPNTVEGLWYGCMHDFLEKYLSRVGKKGLQSENPEQRLADVITDALLYLHLGSLMVSCQADLANAKQNPPQAEEAHLTLLRLDTWLRARAAQVSPTGSRIIRIVPNAASLFILVFSPPLFNTAWERFVKTNLLPGTVREINSRFGPYASFEQELQAMMAAVEEWPKELLPELRKLDTATLLSHLDYQDYRDMAELRSSAYGERRPMGNISANYMDMNALERHIKPLLQMAEAGDEEAQNVLGYGLLIFPEFFHKFHKEGDPISPYLANPYADLAAYPNTAQGMHKSLSRHRPLLGLPVPTLFVYAFVVEMLEDSYEGQKGFITVEDYRFKNENWRAWHEEKEKSRVQNDLENRDVQLAGYRRYQVEAANTVLAPLGLRLAVADLESIKNVVRYTEQVSPDFAARFEQLVAADTEIQMMLEVVRSRGYHILLDCPATGEIKTAWEGNRRIRMSFPQEELRRRLDLGMAEEEVFKERWSHELGVAAAIALWITTKDVEGYVMPSTFDAEESMLYQALEDRLVLAFQLDHLLYGSATAHAASVSHILEKTPTSAAGFALGLQYTLEFLRVIWPIHRQLQFSERKKEALRLKFEDIWNKRSLSLEKQDQLHKAVEEIVGPLVKNYGWRNPAAFRAMKAALWQRVGEVMEGKPKVGGLLYSHYLRLKASSPKYKDLTWDEYTQIAWHVENSYFLTRGGLPVFVVALLGIFLYSMFYGQFDMVMALVDSFHAANIFTWSWFVREHIRDYGNNGLGSNDGRAPPVNIFYAAVIAAINIALPFGLEHLFLNNSLLPVSSSLLTLIAVFILSIAGSFVVHGAVNEAGKRYKGGILTLSVVVLLETLFIKWVDAQAFAVPVRALFALAFALAHRKNWKSTISLFVLFFVFQLPFNMSLWPELDPSVLSFGMHLAYNKGVLFAKHLGYESDWLPLAKITDQALSKIIVHPLVDFKKEDHELYESVEKYMNKSERSFPPLANGMDFRTSLLKVLWLRATQFTSFAFLDKPTEAQADSLEEIFAEIIDAKVKKREENTIKLVFTGLGERPDEMKETLRRLYKAMAKRGQDSADWHILVYAIDAEEPVLQTAMDDFQNMAKKGGFVIDSSRVLPVRLDIQFIHANVFDSSAFQNIRELLLRDGADFVLCRNVLYIVDELRSLIDINRLIRSGSPVPLRETATAVRLHLALENLLSMAKPGAFLVIDPDDNYQLKSPSRIRRVFRPAGTTIPRKYWGGGILKVQNPVFIQQQTFAEFLDSIADNARTTGESLNGFPSKHVGGLLYHIYEQEKEKNPDLTWDEYVQKAFFVESAHFYRKVGLPVFAVAVFGLAVASVLLGTVDVVTILMRSFQAAHAATWAAFFWAHIQDFKYYQGEVVQGRAPPGLISPYNRLVAFGIAAINISLPFGLERLSIFDPSLLLIVVIVASIVWSFTIHGVVNDAKNENGVFYWLGSPYVIAHELGHEAAGIPFDLESLDFRFVPTKTVLGTRYTKNGPEPLVKWTKPHALFDRQLGHWGELIMAPAGWIAEIGLGALSVTLTVLFFNTEGFPWNIGLLGFLGTISGIIHVLNRLDILPGLKWLREAPLGVEAAGGMTDWQVFKWAVKESWKDVIRWRSRIFGFGGATASIYNPLLERLGASSGLRYALYWFLTVIVASVWETLVFHKDAFAETGAAGSVGLDMILPIGFELISIGVVFAFAHTIVSWMLRGASGEGDGRRFWMHFVLSILFSLPQVLAISFFSVLSTTAISLPFISIDLSIADVVTMGLHSLYNALVLAGLLPRWALASIVNPYPGLSRTSVEFDGQLNIAKALRPLEEDQAGPFSVAAQQALASTLEAHAPLVRDGQWDVVAKAFEKGQITDENSEYTLLRLLKEKVQKPKLRATNKVILDSLLQAVWGRHIHGDRGRKEATDLIKSYQRPFSWETLNALADAVVAVHQDVKRKLSVSPSKIETLMEQDYWYRLVSLLAEKYEDASLSTKKRATRALPAMGYALDTGLLPVQIEREIAFAIQFAPLKQSHIRRFNRTLLEGKVEDPEAYRILALKMREEPTGGVRRKVKRITPYILAPIAFFLAAARGLAESKDSPALDANRPKAAGTMEMDPETGPRVALEMANFIKTGDPRHRLAALESLSKASRVLEGSVRPVEFKDLSILLLENVQAAVQQGDLRSEQERSRLSDWLGILSATASPQEREWLFNNINEMLARREIRNEGIYALVESVDEADGIIEPLMNENGALRDGNRLVFVVPTEKKHLKAELEGKFKPLVEAAALQVLVRQDEFTMSDILIRSLRAKGKDGKMNGGIFSPGEKITRRLIYREGTVLPGNFFDLSVLLPEERRRFFVDIILKSFGGRGIEMDGSQLPALERTRKTLMAA